MSAEKYRIQFSGVVMLIHYNPLKLPMNRHVIRLRYTADVLMSHSLWAVHTKVVEFLSSLGLTVNCDVPSRADMQVMIDVPMSVFR